MAAGMSISRENISAFSVAINNYAQTFHPIMPIPALTIDGIIDPSVLTLEQAQSLDFLKPFGSGNQQPVFAVLSTVVTGITDLSAGKHTKIKFIKNNIPFEGLIFFENKNQLFFDTGDSIDIAFALTWNTFRDKPNITVKILDIHPPKLDVRAFYVSKQTYERCRNGCQVSCNPLPNRIEVAALYRFLSKNKGMINDFDVIYFRMVREGDVDYVRMRIAFDALLELGLICVADSYCGKVIQPNPSAKKTALENSSILRSLTATL
jgi:single-stranded-DNA-specific exonuclease